jgi:hypothetical protein
MARPPGAPGRPALARLRAWAQGSPGEGVGRARVPAVGGWGWRESRRRWAAAQARCLSVGDARRGPPPRHRSPAPAASGLPPSRIVVTAPGRAVGPSSTRRGILSPRKFAVKGATARGLRVPPLRSGQTPDSELSRQDPARAGRTGKNRPTTRTRPDHRRGRLRPRPPRPGQRILDSRYFISRSIPTSRAPSATWTRNFIRRRLAADRFSVGASWSSSS